MGLQINLDSNFQTEQLETLGMLASGIAHDFNNLLTSIVGQTSLALLMLPPEDSARKHLEKALQAAEVAAGLSKQLLDYAGNQNSKIEPVNLNELISANFNLYNLLFLHAGCIRLELAPSIPHIEVRPVHIQQILMNLIINAAEAMSGGDEMVTIRTGIENRYLQDENGKRDRCIPRKIPFVYLQVQDCGRGMSKKILDQIFDPFFSTKPTGNGIGLPTVKEIVRSYGGAINVSSQLNVGTTFTVYLPTVPIKPRQPQQKNSLPN